MKLNRLWILACLLFMSNMIVSQLGAQAAVTTLTATLCGFVIGIRNVIGALAIALFLMGGALYSIANMLPTSLEYRKNLIGWAQAMIIGGLVGFIVVILAQPIVLLFSQIGVGLGGSSVALAC